MAALVTHCSAQFWKHHVVDSNLEIHQNASFILLLSAPFQCILPIWCMHFVYDIITDVVMSPGHHDDACTSIIVSGDFLYDSASLWKWWCHDDLFTWQRAVTAETIEGVAQEHCSASLPHEEHCFQGLYCSFCSAFRCVEDRWGSLENKNTRKFNTKY